MSAVNRIIATNTLCQKKGESGHKYKKTRVLFVLKQLLYICFCRNIAKLLGFNLQRIRFVYFVGRSSIFFACVLSDKLLSDRQHAFRKGHSCETQLTSVINDWAKILDNRGQVDIFILEFEKAFDIPPHELLKSKMFSYGIGGKALKWIDSFLCFRKQRVCCKWSKI